MTEGKCSYPDEKSGQALGRSHQPRDGYGEKSADAIVPNKWKMESRYEYKSTRDGSIDWEGLNIEQSDNCNFQGTVNHG